MNRERGDRELTPRQIPLSFPPFPKTLPLQIAQPPPQVLELIQRFDRNRDAYRSPHYNETQVRREFLDPLFKSLGWDIDNEQGYAEAYKDVIHEDAIKVGEATKAPDYCFRIGGTRKFFLEAKRPSVDIKNDVSPAFARYSRRPTPATTRASSISNPRRVATKSRTN
jgi:hypothetical protein